jgi:hypothetical protein
VDELAPQELLLRAVDGLPAEDRERVLVWLLERSFAGTHLPGAAAALRPELIGSAEALLSRPLGEHRVVPIRLPSDQHAALRDWCAEHGFTMATVIRGLVERFLEERGQRPGRAA